MAAIIRQICDNASFLWESHVLIPFWPTARRCLKDAGIFREIFNIILKL